MSNKSKSVKHSKLYRKAKLVALIFSNNKSSPEIVPIKQGESDFKHKNKRYIVELDEVMRFILPIRKFFIFNYDKVFIFYYNNNPKPLTLQEDKLKAEIGTKTIPAELFNSMIETNIISRANDLNKNSLFDNLDPKIIMILLGALAVGIYLMNGGSIV